jgi:hypothetical protein
VKIFDQDTPRVFISHLGETVRPFYFASFIRFYWLVCMAKASTIFPGEGLFSKASHRSFWTKKSVRVNGRRGKLI